MIIIDQPRIWRAHFDNMVELQEWLASTPFKWTANAPLSTERHCGEHRWTLGHTYADVMRFAREGWEDGVRMVSLRARPAANNSVKRWRNDVAGDMPDIGRFVAGEPAHMRRRGHDNTKKPIVSIVVNNWINAAVKAHQMVNFGAALVSVIDHIENSGKRVELVVGTIAPSSFSCNDRRVMSATWTVKRPDEPMDLAALALSVAHPGASRRIGWSVWAHSNRSTDKGYGVAVDWKVRPEHLIDPAHDLLIIPGLNGHWHDCQTTKDAEALVVKQINDAAGETIVELEDE